MKCKNRLECWELLTYSLKTHNPDGKCVEQKESLDVEESRLTCLTRILAGKIITPPEIRWAVNSFLPQKSPGGDKTIPAQM